MLVFSRFLRYFLEVARLGSIRKASESLSVSASAIDRQILSAEEELGVPLFERLPGGLRVTAAGELLLAAGRRWTREYARLQSQMDDLTGLRRGAVHIVAIDALNKGFLPRALLALRREFPGITVHMTVVRNAEVEAVLQRGDADFGLMLAPKTSRDIIVHAHRNIVLGLVARPEHALGHRPSIRFANALEFPLIVPMPPLALCDQVAALEAAAGLRIEPAMASNNIEMIKSLVSEGAGVGILTSLDVMEEVETGQLAFTPFSDKLLKPMPLALCVDHSRQLSQAARLALARVEAALLQSAGPGAA